MDVCRLCNEPTPGPYRGHATKAERDSPYRHNAEPRESDGTAGQDRESYTDTQDRDNYGGDPWL